MKPRHLAAIGPAGLLGLAACGPSGDDDSGSSGTQRRSQPGDERPRVRLGRHHHPPVAQRRGHRARAGGPHAFLMDEPLSNLDAKLRVQMRAGIARLHRDLGVTTLYVTQPPSPGGGPARAPARRPACSRQLPPATWRPRPSATSWLATWPLPW